MTRVTGPPMKSVILTIIAASQTHARRSVVLEEGHIADVPLHHGGRTVPGLLANALPDTPSPASFRSLLNQTRPPFHVDANAGSRKLRLLCWSHNRPLGALKESIMQKAA